jgi:hypothetical protein
LLHEDKQGTGNPINEGSSWPGVGERQVEELEDLEEGPKSVDEPVLIFLRDSSLHSYGIEVRRD